MRATLIAAHAAVLEACKVTAPALKADGLMGRIRVQHRPGWCFIQVTVRVEQSWGDSLARDGVEVRGRLERAFQRAGLEVVRLDGELRVYPRQVAAVAA